MESSSENSFVWTDTSSDSTSMATDDTNDKSDENCDFDNGRKRNKKISLTRKLGNSEQLKKGEEHIKGEQYNNCSQPQNNLSANKKMVKLEPESDYDLPKKKKKIKNSESNENQSYLQESMSYDLTYLNMKVKEEGLDVSSSTKHKYKKQKQQSRTDSKIQLTRKEKYQNESTNENIQESEYDPQITNSKKKKKKSKRRHDSGDVNIEIESKMDIEEILLNKQDNFEEENETFNEESGCDEISAIKCDDEHNLHSISIINKSLEDITKTKIDNSLNVTTHQLKSSSEHDSEKSEPPLHRTQRISDRIRFEDDDDDDINDSTHENEHRNENSKKSAKLEQFVRTNSDLRLLSQTLDKSTRLSSDDEIWIIKCPKEIDIKDLKSTTLNIHSKCKIKVTGQTYDGSAEEQSGTVPLLTIEGTKYKIRNLPLSGIVNLRKRIPKAHYCDDNVMVNNQTNFIPLPDTKCRHPLFGSNYKKALKIPTAIAERLNVQDGQEYLIKAERRKKKKDKKDRNKANTVEQVNPQEQHDLIIKIVKESDASVEITEKKKKKRKVIDDDGPPKKMKRIKHDLESAEAWESEKAIEENLFNF